MSDLDTRKGSFYQDIRDILDRARRQAYVAVNSAMLDAYWQIGKRIVEEEQGGVKRASYGHTLIKHLSVELGAEFGRGFSVSNLKNFRQFYITFRDDEKGYTLCSELTWSHVRLIMRQDDPQKRVYYLQEAKAQNWSVRQLERSIQTYSFKRMINSKSTNIESVKPIANSFIKDPYVLEFLNLSEQDPIKESAFEKAIIANLQHFLLEMGRGFSFVGRQFRISTETSHFYVDLVFYNFVLKCFVIIDLKTSKLTHQDIGQMDMYVRMFDDLKRSSEDNPTIGIILCNDKDETVVRYSVLAESEHLFASKYRLVLPTETELEEELAREVREIAGGSTQPPPPPSSCCL